MQKKRAIVWFRQDLRVHDNEALADALASAHEIIPVYVFDERVYLGETKYGFPKTGKFRAQFMLEAVADLRSSLQQLGSHLVVRMGKPEEELFELARQVKSSWIFCNRERTQEETDVQDALEERLWTIGQEMRYSRGKMLYYTADLPFPITHTPDTFAQFRKEVERYIPIREPLPQPEQPLNMVTVRLDYGELPTLQDLGHHPFQKDPRATIAFQGGETAGCARLQAYLWETHAIQNYLENRRRLMGPDLSSNFSAWLAAGCLSPKLIYHELKKYERENGKSDATYKIFLELMWRDFFRFMAKKYGNKIFQKGGISGQPDAGLRDDDELLDRWINGQTGVPFIDAHMRELKHTGFMTNRGRQNVASFLVRDLGVNWQMGADYFESILIDYDPTSNYGNWNAIAGVGSDQRDERHFNILSQARKYDFKGEYVRRWVPELREVPSDKIHQPDTLSYAEQIKYGVKIGEDYPEPLVNTGEWG